MKRHADILSALRTVTLLSLCMILLSSCVFDYYDDDAQPQQRMIMSLSLSANISTRTSPQPGEDGDYSEIGTVNENKVNELTVFFYHGAQGPNSDPDTEIIYSYYTNAVNVAIDNATEFKFELVDYRPAAGDRVLVAANVGDLTACRTLGEVTRYIVDKAWQAGERPALSTHFAMANCDSEDGRVVFSRNGETLDGSAERPFYASVNVERVAARADFCFNNANIRDGRLQYAVTDKNNNITADVVPTHLLPVNTMQEGSWLMKHTTAGNSNDFSCFQITEVCGVENIDALGHADNYVVAPTTPLKQEPFSQYLPTWFGNTASSEMRLSCAVADNFINPEHIYAKYAVERFMQDIRSDRDYDRRFTITYLNENTQHRTMQNSSLCTGLLIRAFYIPRTVYSDSKAENTTPYSRGTTFWRLTATRVNMSENDALYFSNYQAAVDYRDSHPSLMAEIQEFENGICWYTVWLRHADCSDTTAINSTPMEFGIVRNNVYKIGVNFSGPGRPTPDIEEPYGIQYRIFVRKWNFRFQSEIIM